MDAREVPGLNRRRFLTTSAVAAGGLGAAGLTATAAAASAAPGSSQSATGLTEAVLAAFQTHRLVGISIAHGGQEGHDLLMTMLSDSRLYEVVDDIITESGNAFYQHTLDQFILGDKPVNDADLRLVYRNITQSPDLPVDSPVIEQIYRRVRAINWTQPADKRIRVLAGDPPFDWSKVTSASQIPVGAREAHPASLAEQSLANRRRALLLYGGNHVVHNYKPFPNVTSLIEQKTGVRTYVIIDLTPMTTDPGGVFRKLAAYPRGTVIPTAGTWFGKISAGDILPGIEQLGQSGPPKLINPWCGQTIGQLVDAGVYIGQAGEVTASWPDPAIFLDPVYWKELQRRNKLQRNQADLDTFRQQHPPAYPLPVAGSACLATG